MHLATEIVFPVIDGNIYFDKATGVITKSNDNITEAIIPEKIGKESVVGIAPYAFADNHYLRTLVLPNSIQYIDSHAFEGCTALEIVQLPNNSDHPSIKMGEAVFQDCKSLKTMTLPPIVKMNNKEPVLPKQTFCGCYSLEKVEKLETLTEITKIEYGAFAGCFNLKTIKLPDNVKFIEPWAFAHCTSLQTINLPNNVQYIGESAFKGCKSLNTNISKPLAKFKINTT